jgi:hypothetical protein
MWAQLSVFEHSKPGPQGKALENHRHCRIWALQFLFSGKDSAFAARDKPRFSRVNSQTHVLCTGKT